MTTPTEHPTGVDSERPEIPDLVFEPPDCPICAGDLEYDDAHFECVRCLVVWPSDGDGREAESLRADNGQCESRCPHGVHWAWEGEFCHLPATHVEDDGTDHEIDPERLQSWDGPVRWPAAPSGDAHPEGEGR